MSPQSPLRRRARASRLVSLLAPVLVALVALACRPAAATDPLPGEDPPMTGRATWSEVDRLIDEQKLAEAAKLLDRLETAAREGQNDQELASVLVRQTQIGLALGGYETAVEALRAKAWPEEPLARATVELYDAHALLGYLGAYGWEIRQREKVVSGAAQDLKLWTADQIVAEADRAFARVWAQRDRLGELAPDALAELRPNDYPDRIRPTLRDAVAYLWAERLADSAHWSADESAELWKLDRDALADGRTVEPTPERLADEPLQTARHVVAAGIFTGIKQRQNRQTTVAAPKLIGVVLALLPMAARVTLLFQPRGGPVDGVLHVTGRNRLGFVRAPGARTGCGARNGCQNEPARTKPHVASGRRNGRVADHGAERPVSARVAINERTGTVVMGGDVRLGPAAVAHGNLSVRIATQYEVSQPAPFSSGQTQVVPQTELDVAESDAQLVALEPGATLGDVVRALNMLGATPRDIIAVMQALKAAGALRAELVIL